jgi:hypothetical protein
LTTKRHTTCISWLRNSIIPPRHIDRRFVTRLALGQERTPTEQYCSIEKPRLWETQRRCKPVREGHAGCLHRPDWRPVEARQSLLVDFGDGRADLTSDLTTEASSRMTRIWRASCSCRLLNCNTRQRNSRLCLAVPFLRCSCVPGDTLPGVDGASQVAELMTCPQLELRWRVLQLSSLHEQLARHIRSTPGRVSPGTHEQRRKGTARQSSRCQDGT